MARRKLTKQQLSRIKKSQKQRIKDAKQDIQDGETEKLLSGTVVAHFGQALDVEDSDANIIHCKARQNLQLVCGDSVYWLPEEDGSGVITAFEPRRSCLTRSDFHGNIKPVVANVDQVVIVCANKPEFRETLIDQYIIATEQLGITPVVVLNKIDLIDAQDLQKLTHRLTVYSDIGYAVIQISAKQQPSLDKLTAILNNKTSILVGQSGVGKSTIIKHLLPHEQIEIGALSEGSGKGKHTTTVSRLYHLADSGNIIDSPGVRDFGLGEISKQDLLYGFIEFRELIGTCKFKNCTHINEPGCSIIHALERGDIAQSRYDSYRQLFSSRE